MGLRVTFYKYSKKVNSTVTPPFAHTPASVFLDVTLKDDTNILNPTLLIGGEFRDIAGSGDLYTPNYLQIEEFGRYYYVVNMTWAKGIWQIDCKVDVLATYKTEIGQQSLFIKRSASSSDGDVIDSVYPAKSTPTLEWQGLTSPWTLSNIESTSYIVGIVGQSTTYYIFSYATLQTFLSYIMSDDYVDDLYGSNGWLTLYPELKALTNPLQYISSIRWFPFTTTGTSQASVRVGWVDVPVASQKVEGQGTKTVLENLTIQYRHPQASARGSYLNNAPFSRYKLSFPPFGEVELSPNVIAQATSLVMTAIVDLRTGLATLRIQDGDLNLFSIVEAEVGVDYQVSQVVNKGVGTAQIASGYLQVIGGALKGDVQGMVSSTMNTIEGFAKSSMPSATTMGSNGGINALNGPIQLQSEFNLLVDEDNTRKGRPLCKVRTINTLSGFIQVDQADIDIATTAGEQESIRGYMEGGFYYE